MSEHPETSRGGAVRAAFAEIGSTVRGFVRSPRALWGVNVPYFLEGIAYFGVLTLLMKYLSENLGLGDIRAGLVVSLFTGGITFAMFFLGELGDRWGLRRTSCLRSRSWRSGGSSSRSPGPRPAARSPRRRSCSPR